jgi:hypothetical protein
LLAVVVIYVIEERMCVQLMTDYSDEATPVEDGWRYGPNESAEMTKLNTEKTKEF